ncbi:response regulator [Geomonas diazotrophica]|uniref:response regulator n=1 Tax=Geomonas diazotrophica TaxID=2843197 RepID=UPI001EF2EFCA|nr:MULTISPECIES: response regulator transcription factor [Geomonas]
MKNIFLVDDDLRLRRLVAKFLGEYGFTTREFPDGGAVVEALHEGEPAAVILDIMLPGENGLSILKRIREESAVPVIMLTARGDDEDRIAGLELGADDYLPKPFNPRELLARINAVLRRSQPTPAGDRIEAGGFVLLRKRRTVSRQGQEVELSATEHRLLEALMSYPGTVLTREALLNYARGKDFGPFDRSIDVHISKLRTKTEQISGGKRCIKTVWGSGYMFEVEEP